MERIGADHAIGTFGPVLVCVWEHATTHTGANDVVAVAEWLASSPAQQVPSLIVVPAHSKLPGSAVRRRASQVGPILGDKNVGIALVYEGDGFRASAVRGIMTGIRVVVRARVPLELFSHVWPAVDWVGSIMTERLDRPGLRAYVEELRAKVPPRRAP